MVNGFIAAFQLFSCLFHNATISASVRCCLNHPHCVPCEPILNKGEDTFQKRRVTYL